jgi:MutS-like protein
VNPRERYAGLTALHREAHQAAKSRSFQFGTVRAITFIALFAAWVAYDLLEGVAGTVSLVLFWALVIVFFWEIVVHRRVRREEAWHGALLGLAEEGTLRLDRSWDELEEALPERETTAPVDYSGHPFGADLAMLGQASLFRLMGPITSEPGRTAAAGWLLDPATPTDAEARAESVRELSDRLDARFGLAAHGRLAPDANPQAVARFVGWLQGDAWILSEVAVRVASWVLPAALIASGVADFFWGAPPFWILPGLAQLVVLRRVTTRLSADFVAVEALAPALAAYVPQLREVTSWEMKTPLLSDLHAQLESDGVPAHERLEALGRVVDTVASRRNLVYASLAPFLLLDVHLGVRLDHWRKAHGAHALGWLGAFGQIEALCGLACLAHDHPDWTFPEWHEESRIEGKSVGHPLLPPHACVRNDVTVGPPGTFMLVTGSNMSGKSTLLRSIGTNAVLAGAGGPVCADVLSLPRVRVRTSMSVEDSLSTGVSLFMAQLLRVKDIVEEASRESPDEGPVLFLLDEMLHGTNSAERRIAAQAVLRHLIESRAIGAVSSHDLGLADAEDLRAVADAVHFRETVERDDGVTRLDFDYTMRPGLASTSNALVLLQAVGLKALDEADTAG